MTEFKIDKDTIEDNIKRQIKKHVIMTQIEKKCSIQEALDITVNFLVSTIKEIEKGE